MTKFNQKSFSVGPGDKESQDNFRSGWDRTFGKKKAKPDKVLNAMIRRDDLGIEVDDSGPHGTKDRADLKRK